MTGNLPASPPDADFDAALDRAARRAAAALERTRGPEALGVAMRETAHQFNNLLTVLQSSAELLGMPNLPEDRRGRYLHAIGDATDRAAKLVGALQALARSAAPRRLTFDVTGRLAGAATGPAGLAVFTDAAGFDAAIATLVAALKPSSAQPRPEVRVTPAAGRPAWRGLPASDGPHVVITLSGAAGDTAFRGRLLAVLETVELPPEWLELFAFLARSAGALHVCSSDDGAPVFVLTLPMAEKPEAA